MAEDQRIVVLLLTEVQNIKQFLENNQFCAKNFKFLEISETDVLRAQNSTQNHDQVFSQATVMIADPPILTKAPFFDFFFNISQDYKGAGLHSIDWIQATFAGIDSVFKAFSKINVDPTKLKNCPKLTRIGGTTFGPPIFEVVQHILNHERAPTTTEWEDWKSYRVMSQLSIGILGFGCIGQYIVKALQRGFGVSKIFVLKRSKLPSDLEKVALEGNSNIKIFALEDLEDQDFWNCLPEMDYLINILPSTPDTRHFLNAKIFKKSIPKGGDKSKLVFINCGRGDIVEEKEIVESLEQDYLSHACLDVFEVEPLPESSPLWELQECGRVDITPHNAGISFANSVIAIFNENSAVYLKNDKNTGNLKYSVDFSKSY